MNIRDEKVITQLRSPEETSDKIIDSRSSSSLHEKEGITCVLNSGSGYQLPSDHAEEVYHLVEERSGCC